MSQRRPGDPVPATAVARRTVLRAAGAAAVLGGPVLVGGPVLLAPAAGALSSGGVPLLARRVAFGEDPRTQMRVRWQVGGQVTGAKVRYGTDAGYGQDVVASVRPLRTEVPGGRVVEQWYVAADLGGLKPGTTYHYQVVHDGGVVSADATFRTAPAAGSREPFTFTVFGDQGVSPNAQAVTALTRRLQPAFHLHAGNLALADRTGLGLPTDPLDPTRWDRYLAQVEPVAASVPWMVAAGNHDLEAVTGRHGYGGLVERFALPTDGPSGCPTVYSFVHGPVGVVVLDSNDLSGESSAARGYSQGRQVAWLTDRLAALRGDPAVDFVVAVVHHGLYATGTGHGSDAAVRSVLAPVFDTFAVDLVVSAHNRVYERTDPVRGGGPAAPATTGSEVVGTVGTSYVTVGGGGAPLDGFDVSDSYRFSAEAVGQSYPSRLVAANGAAHSETAAWSRIRYTGYSVLAVDVDPGPPDGAATLRLRAVDLRGRVVDDVTLVRPAPGWLQRNGSRVLLAAGGVVGAGITGAVLLGRSTRSAPPVRVPADDAVPDERLQAARDAASRRRAAVLEQASRAAIEALDAEPVPGAHGPVATGPGGVPDGVLVEPFEQLALDLGPLPVVPVTSDEAVTASVEAAAGPPDGPADTADDVECFETEDSRYLDGAWLPWPFVTDADADADGEVDTDAEDGPDGSGEPDERDEPGEGPGPRGGGTSGVRPGLPAQRRPDGAGRPS